ncbi:phage regulatory CII family protein [Paracandidimonas soli]|nr:phage regulatory CII family protein [Paracandidimonas soli]
MTFEQAALGTAADYPGGARGLAAAIGMNGSVLAHKVSLTDRANQLTVPQARTIMLATGDYRMLHGLAGDLDHVCVRVTGLGDSECVGKSISETAREFGEFLTAVTVAVADDDVIPNEMRRIDRELTEMIAAANHLRALCAAMGRRRGGRK